MLLDLFLLIAHVMAVCDVVVSLCLLHRKLTISLFCILLFGYIFSYF